MNRRLVVGLLTALVLILAVGLGSWSWLMHSESGARWLVQRLESAVPGEAGTAGVSGDLGSGLQLTGLYFDDGNTRVEVGRLEVVVDIGLFPPVIGLEKLLADSVLVRTLEDSGQKTNPDNAMPDFSLPVRLSFDDVRISGIEAFDVSGNRTVLIHSIAAAGNLYRELLLDRLVVELPGQEIALSGRLGLVAPSPLSLDFHASGSVAFNGSLNGTLESAALELKSSSPEIRVSGTLEQLHQTPTWDLDISSPGVQWPLNDPETTARLDELVAHTRGRLSHYSIDLTGTLGLRGLDPLLLELDGNGTGDDFEADRLSLHGPELSLNATGAVSWKNGLSLQLQTALERLDVTKWLKDWPEDSDISGEFGLQWSGENLNISGFSLAAAHSPLSANGHGVIDLRSGLVDAELHWRDFSWPPGASAPRVESSSGSFVVSGRPDDWILDGQLALRAAAFPASQVRLSGRGDMESLEATVHESAALGGILSGEFGWNWTGAQPFHTTLNLDSIDLGPVLPGYPAEISAFLTAAGELEPFRVGVDITRLDGTFQGLPFNARGGFHVEQTHIFADQLEFATGASTLSLNGSLYDPVGVDFAANIDNLARFSDEFTGSVSTRGTVSLYPQAPLFLATLSAQQLALGPVQVERIETREPAGPGTNSEREVIFTGLVIGQRPVESLSFSMGGEEPLQRIRLHAVVEGTKVDLELDGSIDDWANPLTSGWSGSLSELRIDLQDQFTLALEGNPALELDSSHFRLESACFNGSHGARMCLESSWSDPDELLVSAELEAVPVGLLELFADTSVRFNQILSGTLNWSQSAERGRAGGAHIEISPGIIELVGGEELQLETGPGLLGFDLVAGQLQNGRLDISFPGSGEIDLDFSVPDFSLGPDSPIQGTALLDLNDIGVVGVMLPLFDTINGALDINLRLSGTLSDPTFHGRAALVDGQLENRASGFAFSEINLEGEVSEFDRSVLKGSFRAGEGTGEISTILEFEELLSPVIQLSLKGETLTLIDVPDLKVIADPDIKLNWRSGNLEINGSLGVPTARLSPSYLPESSISQSEDVVIVAGELPAPERQSLKNSTIRFGGELVVELGDNVTIEADLAKVDVNGATRFNWQGDPIPVANGGFDVSGDIEAYGQLLRITQGRIGFPGIPADNPHLNIRAEREIFGNSQIRSAGLMVAGTLRRPLVEPYTVPMTNRDRARTLLVTGSDFNYEQGVGAVDVGMYILPRLYISYGIGVFEDGNVIRVRYDLARGFGIMATSGERETGMDISYTFER